VSSGNANDSGKTFEYVVGSLLISQNVKWIRGYNTRRKGEYGEDITVDFYCEKVAGFPEGLYVECRWQESQGSVDKKNSALKDNILKHYDKPTIVVCGGSKVDAGYNVLLGACRCHGGNLKGVFRLEDFVAFVPSLRNGQASMQLQKQFNPDQKDLF